MDSEGVLHRASKGGPAKRGSVVTLRFNCCPVAGFDLSVAISLSRKIDRWLDGGMDGLIDG